MLNEQKIIFVSIIDNDNTTVPDLGIRIWHYQTKIKLLLQTETCVFGRKTYELTQWKGRNSWVLTRNKKWRKSGIGTIHSLDDLHLFCEGPIYVLGGDSLFNQLEEYVDELHLWVLNNNKGKVPWIDLNMKDWKPVNYKSAAIWSYAHLQKVKNCDPLGLNQDLFTG
jgi:dihydrofolate reductase